MWLLLLSSLLAGPVPYALGAPGGEDPLRAQVGSAYASSAPAFDPAPTLEVAAPDSARTSPQVATPHDDPAESVLLASPTRIDRIGRIVVQVMINGEGPFRFIVDTGASHSTVSPALARKLGLDSSGEPEIEVNGITGTARVPAVTISRLQVGDLTIENTRFPVVWAPLMAGADGILGAAGFTEQRLFVDFQHNRVVITRADHSSKPAGHMRIPAMRLTGGLIAVVAHVGGVKVRAVIDTGSERSLGNLALQNALNARRQAGVIARITKVYGATADVVQGDLQVAPVIAIDSLRMADVTLVFGDFHIFEVWNLQAEPAMIIGMDVLGTVASLGIDFKQQSLFFRDTAAGTTAAAMHSYSFERGRK